MRLAVPILSVAALLAVCGSSTVAAASSSKPHLAGTWTGHYSGAYSGKFTIHWKQTGSRLSGSITLSNPPGKYSINGAVSGSSIKFGAVGAGATYTGSVSGKSMSGKYKTRKGPGAWSARKTG
ncbi:MAG TPA: hypothetical protein VH416_08890 [Gaiellaceae bacterium]|jgi:hypothetical protein